MPPLDNATLPSPPIGSTIIVVHLAALISVISFGIASPLFGVSYESLVYAGCVVLLAQFIWSIWSWKALTGSVFDPYIFFLVAAILFNGGQALLEVFHLNVSGILHDAFPIETIAATLFLVIVGLGSMHLGALLSAVKGQAAQVNKVNGDKADEAESFTQSSVRVVGWVLLLISVGPAFLTLRDAIGVVLSGGYAALYQTEAGTGFSASSHIIAIFLVPAALFLLVGSKGSRPQIVVSQVVLMTYAVSELFLGFRYYAIMPILAYVWLWHVRVRPLSRRLVALMVVPGAFVLLMLLPLIAATRNTSQAERLSPEFLISTFASIDNPLVAPISEMGGSMKTVAYTVQLVPMIKDYDMGVGYLYSFLTIVPNLFWDIHPTIAHGTPDSWLIWTVDPYIARLGGSLGYSFIAEAFFNFGWLGAIAVLGVIGFLYSKLVLWAYRSGHVAKLAMVASYSVFFTFYAREDAATIFRPLIWYALIPYILVHIVSYLRRPRFWGSQVSFSTAGQTHDGVR
jgi:oligosaccharide repeat unit polymerase